MREDLKSQLFNCDHILLNLGFLGFNCNFALLDSEFQSLGSFIKVCFELGLAEVVLAVAHQKGSLVHVGVGAT